MKKYFLTVLSVFFILVMTGCRGLMDSFGSISVQFPEGMSARVGDTDEKITVTLETTGDFESSVSAEYDAAKDIDGKTFKINAIPVNSKVRVDVGVWAGEKKLYAGSSEEIVVKNGSNPVNITLKKYVSDVLASLKVALTVAEGDTIYYLPTEEITCKVKVEGDFTAEASSTIQGSVSISGSSVVISDIPVGSEVTASVEVFCGETKLYSGKSEKIEIKAENNYVDVVVSSNDTNLTLNIDLSGAFEIGYKSGNSDVTLTPDETGFAKLPYSPTGYTFTILQNGKVVDVDGEVTWTVNGVQFASDEGKKSLTIKNDDLGKVTAESIIECIITTDDWAASSSVPVFFDVIFTDYVIYDYGKEQILCGPNLNDLKNGEKEVSDYHLAKNNGYFYIPRYADGTVHYSSNKDYYRYYGETFPNYIYFDPATNDFYYMINDAIYGNNEYKGNFYSEGEMQYMSPKYVASKDTIVFVYRNEEGESPRLYLDIHKPNDEGIFELENITWITLENDMFDEKFYNSSIKDVILLDDTVYVLLSSLYGFRGQEELAEYQRGALYVIPLASPENFKRYGFNEKVTTIRCSGKDARIYGNTDPADLSFFAPQNFVAIRPKKLCISDTGFFDYKDAQDANSKGTKRSVSRVIEFDLEKMTLTKVNTIDSKLVSKERYEVRTEPGIGNSSTIFEEEN